jgi:uncharacterized protein YeaO (DUF488 family)
MPIHVVRLGSPRGRGEGPRLGTVRHPPRGVPKSEHATRDFYDVWLPNLAPSADLLRWIRAQPSIDRAWARFARRYRTEMGKPEAARLLDALAVLSQSSDFAVGCYCEDDRRCHRTLLRDLLRERGAAVEDR